MDRGRYFLIDQLLNSADVEHLGQIAAEIREDYPNVTYPQLDPSDLHVEK
ncbi:hypothetical protein [Mycobacterium sp. GA-2829]|nr:hypothetical protein [Mycobacterium sp. GA-2829]